MINIYPVLTKVKLANDIDGLIKQVLIELGDVNYKIHYWDGRTYKSDWFSEIEFTTNTKKEKIGFYRGEIISKK